jgi:hypothetical protein
VSLLDDIRADQEALDIRVERLLSQIEANAVEAVETTHSFTPVVGAFVGVTSAPKLYRPHWDTDHERDLIFSDINDSLAAANAAASITLIPSEWTPRTGEVDGMETYGPAQPAILILARTTAWRRCIVRPYQINTQGEVTWDERLVESDFDGGPITVPENN